MRTLGRAAALLALCSAAVHVALANAASLASLAMTAMALVCLPCAWHLWRDPRPAVWGLTAAVDTGMLAVHGQMVAAMGTAGGMAHAVPVAAADRATWLVWLGLGLVTGQLLLAAAASTRGLLRRRRPPDAALRDGAGAIAFPGR